MLKFYVVLKADGELKSTHVYKGYKRAENAAGDDGDSVVEVEVPHSRAPLFIRRKQV